MMELHGYGIDDGIINKIRNDSTEGYSFEDDFVMDKVEIMNKKYKKIYCWGVRVFEATK